MKNQEVSFIKNQKKSHEEFSIKMRMMNVISVKDNRHGVSFKIFEDNDMTWFGISLLISGSFGLATLVVWGWGWI